MDGEENRENRNAWTTVGKKPVVKKDKSAEGPSGAGIIGSTKAGAAAKASSLGPAAVRKPEAIRIREEQLKRLQKKTAALPEVLTKRSDSDSDDNGSSEDSDGREGHQVLSQREKAFTKKSQSAPAPVEVSGKLGVNLQAALKKIDYKALSAEVQKAKANTQSNDAWLKLVATNLNDKLKDVPVETSFYAENGFTWRHPLAVAPKNLTQLFDETFSSAPKNLLEGYMEWLITDACRNYLSKLKPIHGSQLIIQHLLSKNPDLISEKNLNDRATDLKTFATRKDESIRDETLVTLWSYGQAGIGSFSKGFEVWYKLMLPLLNDRRYTGFIVAYLEKLLENHKKPDVSKVNKAEVFLNVFDYFFGKNTIHFHKSTKLKMNASYDRLRELLFKNKLRDYAVSYFAQFLMRLGQSHQPEKYHQAACENILACLKVEEKCLDVWWGKHKSSLKDSQILLNYILKNDEPITKAVRRSQRFADFLNDVAEFEPALAKKDMSDSLVEENDQTIELAKKLKQRIKKESSKSSIKRFFLFIFLIAAAVTGEIVYNTPEESYAVQGYAVAKPLAIKYWAVAKPAIIRAWEDYLKPFAFWSAVQATRLAKYSIEVAGTLWASVKTHLPQVYGVLLGAQESAQHLAAQFGALCYQGLRKLDHFLIDMPPISQLAEKAVPVFDYAREQLATGLVYVGHFVESYLVGNATTTQSPSGSSSVKHS